MNFRTLTPLLAGTAFIFSLIICPVSASHRRIIDSGNVGVTGKRYEKLETIRNNYGMRRVRRGAVMINNSGSSTKAAKNIDRELGESENTVRRNSSGKSGEVGTSGQSGGSHASGKYGGDNNSRTFTPTSPPIASTTSATTSSPIILTTSAPTPLPIISTTSSPTASPKITKTTSQPTEFPYETVESDDTDQTDSTTEEVIESDNITPQDDEESTGSDKIFERIIYDGYALYGLMGASVLIVVGLVIYDVSQTNKKKAEELSARSPLTSGISSRMAAMPLSRSKKQYIINQLAVSYDRNPEFRPTTTGIVVSDDLSRKDTADAPYLNKYAKSSDSDRYTKQDALDDSLLGGSYIEMTSS